MRLIDADALKQNETVYLHPAFRELIDAAPTVNIDWTKHETATGSSKSVSVNPAYPLGGSGNYQCSNTVDAVQVVRCRDCKHFELAYYKKDGTENFKYKRGVCCRKKRGMWVSKDWYCAGGERKDDEDK